jgi:inorganic triphosphatase YgiF
MAKEIELKLSVLNADKNVLEQLKECFMSLGINSTELNKKHLENIYYDTPDRVLNKNRMALRIRKKGDAYIQTLKTKGHSTNGLSERGEWEWPRPEPSLDLDVLESLPIWSDDMSLTSLEAVFETNFDRHEAVLKWRDSEIELAFDQGEVSANQKSLPILELELELMSGQVSSLTSLAKALEKYIQLKPSDISKAERGYSLL